MAQRSRRQFPDFVTEVLSASAALTPGAATTGTTVTSTVTVPGAAVGDAVALVTANASIGNVGVEGEVTAADTVTLKFQNVTAGSITPAATTYNVVVWKLDPKLFV